MTITVVLLALAVFISLCLILAYYWSTSRRISRWKRSNIPFVPPTFPLGHKHLSSLLSHSPLLAVDRIYREHADKDLVGFFASTVPLIMIRDPRLINTIYTKSFEKTFQAGAVPRQDDIETQSCLFFSSNKELWKHHRRIMAPIFSPTRMCSSNFGKLTTQVHKMWEYIDGVRFKGQPVVVQEIAEAFVVDFMSLMNFGEDYNSYKEAGRLRKITDLYYDSRLRRLVSFLVESHAPALLAFKLFQFIAPTCSEAISSFLRDKFEYRTTHGIHKGDFIDYLRTLKDRNELHNVKGLGFLNSVEGIEMRQMAGLSFILQVAGTETVTSLCIFATHLLSLHPEHQDRIRQEVAEGFLRQKVNELSYEVMQDLKFTEQCVMESARLYPSLLVNMRTCSEDFQIPRTKYCLRKGDKLLIVPYSVQRDPKYFKDPEKFDPGRWCGQKGSPIPPETFLTFGIGPKKCPGYKMGVNIVISFVASLIHKYNIEPHSHKRQLDVTDFDPLEFSIQQHQSNIRVNLVPCIVN